MYQRFGLSPKGGDQALVLVVFDKLKERQVGLEMIHPNQDTDCGRSQRLLDRL